MADRLATHPMGKAAIAYAFVTAIGLFLLARLDTPAEHFGVVNRGWLLLGDNPLTSVLWGLAAGGLLAAAGELFTRYTGWGRTLTRMLARVVGRLHPVDALLLALLSSVAEEVIFRGILMPYVGLAASSVLFGLAHLVPRKGLWYWSVWAMAAGFLMGGLADYQGGLLAPITAHLTVNAVGLSTLGRRRF